MESEQRKKSLVADLFPDKQNSLKSNKSNGRKTKPKPNEHIVVYLPANYPSCPPGLEKLIPVDHLFVRQGMRQTEPPYAMINKNKFEVLDGEGRRIFLARDSTDNILKLCCRGGCGQPFRMSIKDRNSGYEILAVNARPDCYGAMTASISQNGIYIGFLTEEVRCFSSKYIVIDAQGTKIFQIYDFGSPTPPPDEGDKSVLIVDETVIVSIEQVDHHSDHRGSGSDSGNPSKLKKKPSFKFSLGIIGKSKSGSTSSTENAILTTPDLSKEEEPTTIARAITENVIKAKESGNLRRKRNDKNDEEKSNIELLEMTELHEGKSTDSVQVDQKIPKKQSCPCNYSRCRPCCSSSCSSCCGGGIGIGACLDSCVSLISGGAEFAVYSCLRGVVVGRMGNQWEDLYDNCPNLADCFGVCFPKDMSVRHKALILGALFILDFNHFQL